MTREALTATWHSRSSARDAPRTVVESIRVKRNFLPEVPRTVSLRILPPRSGSAEIAVPFFALAFHPSFPLYFQVDKRSRQRDLGPTEELSDCEWQSFTAAASS
ncbi:hypothetical protein MTO96_021972 [Rhipicephalus appendiculatus]